MSPHTVRKCRVFGSMEAVRAVLGRLCSEVFRKGARKVFRKIVRETFRDVFREAIRKVARKAIRTSAETVSYIQNKKVYKI